MRRLPLRAPPGLSNLAREVIFEDLDGENEHVPHDSRSSNCPDPKTYITPDRNPDEDVPLLRLNRSGEIPRTSHPESYQHLDDKQMYNLEPRKDTQTWNIHFTNAAQQRHKSHLSDTAQCGTTSPTASPSKRDLGSSYPALCSRPRFPRTRAQHPFAKNFEAPQWRLLILHFGVCALAYPFLLLFVVAAREKSLFRARLYVGTGCGLLGATMGVSLVRLARRILESSGAFTILKFL